jgi:hypothetical protein
VTSTSSIGSSVTSRRTRTDYIASVNKEVQQLISRIIFLFGGFYRAYIHHPTTTPTIVWKPKNHYRVHNNPSLLYIPNQEFSLYLRCSLRSILIIYSHLRISLPSDPCPSGFPTRTLHALNFHVLSISSSLS